MPWRIGLGISITLVGAFRKHGYLFCLSVMTVTIVKFCLGVMTVTIVKLKLLLNGRKLH